MPDPDHPFLISPLPQFTTPLTTSNILSFPFTPVPPLPELTDDLEDEDDARDSEDETPTPVVIQQNPQDSKPILQRFSSFRRADERSKNDSVLSDHRRARSGSSPAVPTSRTSPLSNRSADTASDASPPSPPKSTILSQPQQVVSSREGPLPTRSSTSQNPDGGILRTRLYDLLRDSAVSSSLPNMSASHFPPSFTNRETSNGRLSPPPSRSDSSSKTPLLPSSSSDVTGPFHQIGGGKTPSGVAPNCNSAPRQGFSSASTEAKKLEEERRRKLREERQNSQLEKSTNDIDHMSKQQVSTSTSTSKQSFNSIQLSTRRELPSTTTNPLMVSNSGSISSTRRGQSSTGTLGRSGSIVAPTQEEHDVLPHQVRYASIGKARGAILSSSVDSAGIYA